MTKADIVDIVSRATGLTKVDTEVVVDGFIQTIKNAMERGERVDFRGFGSFSLKVRKPKKARNPGTNEEISLPSRIVPVFKPSKLFKERINQEYILK
ncbi:MAG: integration host factor subunit beta [Candidatus Marinimicrobia bacterium]|jgi:nucleoid DNA-binding protein|nr:integration host factor subunit beta [Candidatus Neomarinimicrobiota bacterium]MCK9483205.1 integration host factor subunit beta [Candidatus Neomarinimicrobiota bacterium]MCK9559209.1 integration host factor subunit beta [Candidatus Neomarinimicrobiota bacterium]MDD5062046.1 integration host factor subunit beta [Candidatus Neomarinimicrobiota bacterium]MDD5231706.1 integration host factor subunit beta [Candidatus Neomarinimicrobiota bacterium]